MIRSLFLSLILTACAASGAGKVEERVIWLHITNNNWNASRVTVLCGDGHPLKRINGLDFNSRTRHRIPLRGCDSVSPQIYGLGNLAYFDRRLTMHVNHGDVLCLDIANMITITSLWKCTHRAEKLE